MWKCKGPRMAKIILKASKILGGLTLHNFNTSYKCTLVQLAKNQRKRKHTDKWIKIVNPGVNLTFMVS